MRRGRPRSDGMRDTSTVARTGKGVKREFTEGKTVSAPGKTMFPRLLEEKPSPKKTQQGREFPEPAPAGAPVRKKPLHMVPEAGRVVHLAAMAEFVHEDVLDQVCFRHGQSGGEGEASRGAATSPAGSAGAYREARVGNARFFREAGKAGGDMGAQPGRAPVREKRGPPVPSVTAQLEALVRKTKKRCPRLRRNDRQRKMTSEKRQGRCGSEGEFGAFLHERLAFLRRVEGRFSHRWRR